MNIGITCYPTYGGSGVVATELGKELARLGHTVHFISYDLPNRIVELNERLWFHAVEVTTYPLFHYPPYDLALATKMAEVVETHRLDLLHVHYAIPHAISAYLAKEIIVPKPLPLVTTLHGTDITLVGNDRSFLPITRFGIERSDCVTAVSHYLKEATYREINAKKEITVIPNFIDPEQFKRHQLPSLRRKYAPSGEKLLIHISNFRPVKRVEDVIRIFYNVARRLPARLLMVGDGPERSNGEYLCRQLDICDKVYFLGKYRKVEELLSISDLLLLPSELESFGLVALEAMACEVPVIATNIGGVPELVIHGENGYLAPVGDIEAMSEAALNILMDEEFHARLAANCRSRALNYSSDKIIPLYLKIYRQLLDKEPGAEKRS